MAKKKVVPEKTAELGLKGKGVSPLVIKEVTASAQRYEKAKAKRCAASPGEIAAKQELQALMHKHVDQLPRNADNFPFYTCDEVRYVLKETLTMEEASDGTAPQK